MFERRISLAIAGIMHESFISWKHPSIASTLTSSFMYAFANVKYKLSKENDAMF